ncbi:unconventional myosin-XVB [Callorhinchus milii]|nr:unconventional myosin-XVB [Callorhinchus milii]
MDVGLLEIPAELSALLRLAEGHASENQVSEVSPPQIKACINYSLPPDIDRHPFSKFINEHFQVPQFEVQKQPIQQPFTQLEGEERQLALDIFKLILRFQGDEWLQGRKEEIFLGNFIAQKGISYPKLRNEIFCQLANQMWKNPDMQEWQRACLLMATCLNSFQPFPELEKPLLKYVSDHGVEGYRPLCQHKALAALQHSQKRSFPPSQLEWTANQRRGQMVLDVHLFNDEAVVTEVESWTTAEELASWIFKFWGQETEQKGWSMSLHTGEQWRDVPGSDFIMDLIAETEMLGVFSAQNSSSPFNTGMSGNIYGSTYSSENIYSATSEDSETIIPPAPNIQAPPLPPPLIPQENASAGYYQSQFGAPDYSERPTPGLENYVDNLFNPVFTFGGGEMERSADLNRRMKGGGGIGPTQTGVYMSPGMPLIPSYPMGMPQMPQMSVAPNYQQMPYMGAGVPAAMPVMQPMQQMPTMQPMQTMPTMPMMHPSMPAMMMPQASSMPEMLPMHQPSRYSRSHFSQQEQTAKQQQEFINQQALLLAQQMTIQAMSMTQQQQQQQQHQWQKPHEEEEAAPVNSRTKKFIKHTPKPPVQPVISTPPIQPKTPSVNREPEVIKIPIIDLNKPPKEKVSVPENVDNSDDETLLEQKQSFQEKRQYFQTRGKEEAPVRVPSKIRLPKPDRPKSEEKTEMPETQPEKPKESTSPPPPPPPPPPGPEKSANKEKKEDETKKSENRNKEIINSLYTPPKRVEPSQNIREIIKIYQSRPVPPPTEYEPIRRTAKPFLKKNTPKEEALNLLGMKGHKNDSNSSTDNKPNSGPKVAPKPQRISSSTIHNELTLLLSQTASPPPAPPPPPPPPPSLPAPVLSNDFSPPQVFLDDENIKTQLYRRTASVYFSYVNNNWKLYLRKELFYPREKFNDPYILNLICEQIVRDTYSNSCARISKDERRKMRDLLTELKVGTNIRSVQDDGLKRRIVVAARDNWVMYFSRLFPVCGEIDNKVEVLSISHRDIKLLKTTKATGMSPEHYKVLQSYSYVDVLSVKIVDESTLEFMVKNESLILFTEKASQVQALVNFFLVELRKDSNYVRAVKSYITDEKSLLNFRKGDVIKLLHMDSLEPGWQFGSIGGRSGLFPTDHAQLTVPPDYSNMKNATRRKSMISIEKKVISTGGSETIKSRISSSSSFTSFGGSTYLMTEFGMKYFREPLATLGWKGMAAEGKKAAQLVQHTKIPIQESLIYFTDKELSELGAKNFNDLMRFMGDQQSQKEEPERDFVQNMLRLCKEKESLQDEICCQLIKQVTDNPSRESCIRGWRALYIFLGFYNLSINLRPYVLKYLQEIVSNPLHNYQEVAKATEENLHRTIQFGGRRNMPSTLELDAIMKGRSSRRIAIQLPGELKHTARIKPFSIANDVVLEICSTLGIQDIEETKEFSIFAEKKKGRSMRPLRLEEYLFDFLLDDNSVNLFFHRIMWSEPFHFYNDLYVDVHYNQMLPTYLKGNFILPNNINEMEEMIATLAACQHKSGGAGTNPSMQEIKEYLPKTGATKLDVQSIQQQIVHQLNTMQQLKPIEAKIRFLTTGSSMSLFGYNIFTVKKTSNPQIPNPCLVAINQQHLIVIDKDTKDQLMIIPLKEIVTMCTLRPSETSKLPGVQVNYGSAGISRTFSFELKEARELCHTIAMILDTVSSHPSM